MSFVVLEPASFLNSEVFRQDDFLDGISRYDWDQLAGKKVLVRGCGDVITPPWAYMTIAARLAGVAQSVRYGNEHDNIVVYRTNKKVNTNAQNKISAR